MAGNSQQAAVVVVVVVAAATVLAVGGAAAGQAVAAAAPGRRRLALSELPPGIMGDRHWPLTSVWMTSPPSWRRCVQVWEFIFEQIKAKINNLSKICGHTIYCVIIQ